MPSAPARRAHAADPSTRRRRLATLALLAALAGPLIVAFALSLRPFGVPEAVALALFAVNTAWVAAGAATALLGLALPRRRLPDSPADWRPATRTAVLYLVCGEAPEPIARAVDALWHDLRRRGLGVACDIEILSDTAGAARIAAEESALAALLGRPGLRYRRRSDNAGRKPGNIADWLARRGRAYEAMLVMDADSRITAGRLARLIHAMERAPDLGLIQTGMRLRPAPGRFGRAQRLSARLLGPVFVAGLDGWAGPAANYWGHNALIRTRAFARAACLPRLSGPPPFGGDVLSHDFVEAAFLRRDGWRVALDPETAGSFEDAPQSLAEFHARDRRWCQGNLQHVRLLAAPGLDPVSRLHLLSGIQSYLAAPVWMALVLTLTLGGLPPTGLVPLLGALVLLALPKLAGIADRARSAGARGQRILLRAAASELALSTLLAPLVMVRQTGAVLAVLAGRDCGWKREEAAALLPRGVPEALAGAGFLALALAAGPAAPVWLAPLWAPLCLAPALVRWLDAPGR